MAEGTGNLELKFRLFDGSDIGPSTYSLSTTIAALKERIVAEWPQDKTIVPKAVNDVKLIYSGKVLENAKTLAESKINLGEGGGVVTMHIVVQPSITRKKAVAHLLLWQLRNQFVITADGKIQLPCRLLHHQQLWWPLDLIGSGKNPFLCCFCCEWKTHLFLYLPTTMSAVELPLAAIRMVLPRSSTGGFWLLCGAVINGKDQALDDLVGHQV